MPTYQRPQSSGNLPIFVVGAVVLLLCGVGAVAYFATRGTESKVERGESRDKDTPPAPKATPPAPKGTSPAPKDGGPAKGAAPKAGDTAAAAEREWREAVEAELAQAREKKRVSEPVKGRTMTMAEYQVAVENIPALKRFFTIDSPQQYNLSIAQLAIEMTLPAGEVMPETRRVVRREAMTQYAVMPADQLDRLVSAAPALRPLLDEAFRKRMLARLPAADRQRLHTKFASVTGDREAWSLLHPFDDLDGAEMKAAVAAAERVRDAGLKALAVDERQLLLKAGAVAFLERALP